MQESNLLCPFRDVSATSELQIVYVIYGKVSLRNCELANQLKVTERYNESLKKKCYLINIENNFSDYIEQCGCANITKLYDLRAYGQAIVFVLKNHDQCINAVTEVVIQNSEDIAEMKQQIKNLQKRNELNKEIMQQKDKFIRHLSLTLRRYIMIRFDLFSRTGQTHG